MNQTVKPDRPIWPPVPETIVPQEPRIPHPETQDRDPIASDRPKATSDSLAAFEGFGSVSG